MRTVADLHPEALLDRDARGELSASERARLETHLARCPACRFERQLRSDFADDLASDVTPSSVELLLAGSSKSREVDVTPLPQTSRPIASLPVVKTVSRRRVSRATWLLAAAAVFAVSAAGASGAGQNVLSRLLGDPSATPASEGPLPEHVAAKHASRHRAAPAPTAAVTAGATPDAPTTIDVLVPSSAPAALEPAVRRATSSDGAASLFESATDARRRGDYARALGLQRELQARYPHSRESHLSCATMGRLLLDRGDPAGALASFDAYLAGGSGELGEEAMVGRATALERLGRTEQATSAWQALLAGYPETSYAAHARSRLGSMSVR